MNLFGVLRHGNINSLSSLLPDFISFYFVLIICERRVAVPLLSSSLNVLLCHSFSCWLGLVLSMRSQRNTINIFIFIFPEQTNEQTNEKKMKGGMVFRCAFSVYKSQASSQIQLVARTESIDLELCQLYVDFLRRFRSIHFPFYSDGLYNTTSNILSVILAVDLRAQSIWIFR